MRVCHISMLVEPSSIIYPCAFVLVAVNTLKGLGLEKLTGLKVFDVSDNQITDGPEAIAALLNQLPKLIAFACRGNPGMSATNARVALLSHLSTVVGALWFSSVFASTEVVDVGFCYGT